MARPERAVDPAAGVVEQFAVELRELRRLVGNPGYRELSQRAHYSVSTLAGAASGNRLPSLPVTLAYVRACGADPGRWESRWRSALEKLAPPAGQAAAPYPGLAPFGQKDRDRFFGRGRLVARITERLAHRPLVVIAGPSGSGMTSLLGAGLVPNLLITPGAQPMDACAVTLGTVLGSPPDRLAAEFAGHPRNLAHALRRAAALTGPAEFVLADRKSVV